jgi:hypothetical protein
VEDEIIEDGQMIEEEQKLLEEKKIKEEQKLEVKKHYTTLYKRKRECDEDVGDCEVYKRRSATGYFQHACELLANDEKT